MTHTGTPVPVEGRPLTQWDASELVIQVVGPGVGQGTIDHYARIVRALTRSFPQVSPSELGDELLATWRRELAQQGCSPITIEVRLRFARRLRLALLAPSPLLMGSSRFAAEVINPMDLDLATSTDVPIEWRCCRCGHRWFASPRIRTTEADLVRKGRLPVHASLCRLPIDGRVCPSCESHLLGAAAQTQTIGRRTELTYRRGIQILLDWLGPLNPLTTPVDFSRAFARGGVFPASLWQERAAARRAIILIWDVNPKAVRTRRRFD